MMASFAGGRRSHEIFVPSGTEYPLAIRLSGQIQDSLSRWKTETDQPTPAEQKTEDKPEKKA